MNIKTLNKGVYCILLYINKSRQITIGKLGNLVFQRGYYCYVGSAMNNLEKRILRHKRTLESPSTNKKLRWHIDYLREYSKLIIFFKIKTLKQIEDILSKEIKKISDTSIDKFGASDSKCRSHLHYFKQNPTKQIKMLINTIKINL